ELRQRGDGVARSLRRASLTLEDEAADGFVDRRQVAVQQLLRLVGLGGDERALAKLEDSLLRGRPVAAGAGDEEALVLRHRLARREGRLDRVRQPRDVLAAEGCDGRDRAGV